jgi:hypothetical protein
MFVLVLYQVKDLVLVTAGDQVMLLKWRDWTLD